MNIYVGNLAWKANNQELKELFEHFGAVDKAVIIRDRKTKRSRGFGFVEMPDDGEAQAAIDNLNNTVFMERTIVVNEAKPRSNED
ncbi:MAG TPA: RNA-binding protein [Balneolales bacterium]|nr:RNA-binding protein [Balneolales bacterium]